MTPRIKPGDVVEFGRNVWGINATATAAVSLIRPYVPVTEVYREVVELVNTGDVNGE